MAGIYIHIPFCRQKCRYCDFYSVASEKFKAPMLAALHHELEIRNGELLEPVRTLYFGGGTPTVYEPRELQGLIQKVRELYRAEQPEEITIEANPDDLTDRYLDALRETEINRLSIGIQSFEDTHLQFFNRRHTGRQAYEAVKRAKEAGLANVTVDLIYGIPGMTDRQWQDNLHKFLELDVPHLSAYHLTVEPRTVFGKWAEQGKLTAVPDETSERHYRILEEILSEAGYEHYEISNFSRSGYQARHNSSYWDGTPYIGVGPAAHSYDGQNRRWNAANNTDYLTHLETGKYFERETLSDTDRFNETLMVGLRTARGVSTERIRREFGEQTAGQLEESARKFIQNGLLIHDQGWLRIPSRHFLLSDSVIADLFLV